MSQLISSVNQYINVNALTEWYEKYLLQYTNTKAKRITLGVAVTLAVIGHTLYRLGRPPKHLRHLPRVNMYTILYNLVYKKPDVKTFYDVTSQPLIKKGQDIYVKLDRYGWSIHVANSVAAKQVFLKSDIFPKLDIAEGIPKGTYFQKFSGTENILFSNGPNWLKHRKLANPAFHRAMPVKFFGETARKLFKIWDDSHGEDQFTVDIQNMMERVTLDIIGKAGFDFDFHAMEDENSEWKKIYDEVNSSLANPLYIFFPILERKFLWLFPKRQKNHETLAKWQNMLTSMIEKKRQSIQNNIDQGVEEAEKDLLTLMIESEFRGEGILTNEELLGDLVIFFVAGHDTTAFSLSAAIYYLAKHPEFQTKAREEVNRILCPNGEVDEDILPTVDQTKEFVYLNQIIKETLRINGSVLFLVSPRNVTKDIYLNDVFIPKGSRVNVNIYDLQHNPSVWENPFEFKPERFAENGEADQKAGGGMSWVPFSNGNRQCIGMNFSLAEQRVILACILRKYEWSLPEDSIHKDHLVTSYSAIQTAQKLNIKFKRRY
ncbi:unnamed protein product [Cunninghamella blakesleeana]